MARHHGGHKTTTTVIVTTTLLVTTTIIVTTTLVTTTTLAAPVYPQTTTDQDGAIRINKSCEDIVSFRNRQVQIGLRGCGRNKDLYQVTVAGFTGPQRPVGLPLMLTDGTNNELGVPAGSRFYNLARYNNPQFIYTTAVACTTGARAPAWCTTTGCQVPSGTCNLIASAMPTVISFTDGSATWQSIGYDIGMGGLEGPSARVELGRPFPEGSSSFAWGDNEPTPIVAGRGDYGGIDETVFAAGGWGDQRNGDPGTTVQAGYPGFAVPAGATIGIATSPPLKLTPILGQIPTTNWVCAGPIWENSLDGRTRRGQVRCRQASQGGIQFSMPERDGWSWPRPFPVGHSMLRIYWMVYPGAPCTPAPGQQTCDLYLPRQAFSVELDYLYHSLDSFNVTTNAVPEFDSPGPINSTGMAHAPLAVYEQSVGFGEYQPGGQSMVGYPFMHLGWTYSIYGINCMISTTIVDGQVIPMCRQCDRRWQPVTIPTLTDAEFRTDRYPFGKDGVCFQRGAPALTGVVFRQNGYPGSGCTFRELGHKVDGSGYYKAVDICDGKMCFYNEAGTAKKCISSAGLQ